MSRSLPPRVARLIRIPLCAFGCMMLSASAPAQTTPAHSVEPQPTRRDLRDAESAYLDGAKKLERDNLDGAESDFHRALTLDPSNRNYAIAISVARQHRLTELVQQATRARQSGDSARAETLLAAARALDPNSPIVLEHSQPLIPAAALAPPGNQVPLLSLAETARSVRIDTPILAGVIHLKPAAGVHSFTQRGSSPDVLRAVTSAFGIRAVVDDSVRRKDVHFNLDNVTYQQAMAALTAMTGSFIVPLDENSVIIAQDDTTHRAIFERLLEETIHVPGSTNEQLTELITVIKNLFDVKQATSQPGSGSITIRAAEDVLVPLNQTIQGLIESTPEVMLEVKLYEIDKSGKSDIGTTLPSQFSVFNVEQTANAIVAANQTLVQQGIAQGLILSTDSNLIIALKLIGSGLVQSSLASNILGVFGGGITQTGISASTNLTLNLGLNSTDTRGLDDVQMRIGDRQEATFREGTRYPITSSTYTSGISSAASSALKGATINGVSVSSLLSQYAGSTAATIPQVTYEDLGVTLVATPTILRQGRVSLKLNLKIESLSGSTNDGNPVLQNRAFVSTITLAEGESALLSSYVSKTETAALAGVPGLSELPGFQMPTERTGDTESSELVVVVTPHIIRERAERLSGPTIMVHAAPEN